MFNILDASDSSSHGSAPSPQNQENPSSAAPLTNGFHIHAVAKAVAPLKRMVLHLQTSDQFGSGCVGKLVSRRFEWTHNIWVCSKCKPVAYGVQILRGGPCKGPPLGFGPHTRPAYTWSKPICYGSIRTAVRRAFQRIHSRIDPRSVGGAPYVLVGPLPWPLHGYGSRS